MWQKPDPCQEPSVWGKVGPTALYVFQMLQPALLFVTWREDLQDNSAVFKKGPESMSRVRRQGAASPGVQGSCFLCVGCLLARLGRGQGCNAQACRNPLCIAEKRG